jgi:hypothetical protein
VATPGHVFYERLNTVLNAEKFDQRIEAVCRKYYKSSSGRPSITPGTYFRMLLLGYFEGIDGHSDDVDQSIRCDADQIGAKRRKALSV